MVTVHVFIVILTIFFVWKQKVYKEWRKYHATMLYFSICNLTYNLICANYWLWKFDNNVLLTHTLLELVYSFITFPATVLLFLAQYPEKKAIKRKITYYLTWIGIYFVGEWLLLQAGEMIHSNGWSLRWSLLFDFIMFPMLRLHYKHPLIAYLLSVLIATFLICWFDVPIHIPIEKR
jgi:hypothetical protein